MHHSVFVLAITLALAATGSHAKDPDYIGSVHVVRGYTVPDSSRGTVFLDANRNSKLDADETGIAGVMVSNGREVVMTAEDGSYTLPTYDDMNLFITRPSGYTPPVNADLVPQFNYIHKIKGSPDLRFGGIAPTDPLPESINFPLIEDPVGDRFQCLVFGDTQAYTNQEVSYIRDTVSHRIFVQGEVNGFGRSGKPETALITRFSF